MIYCGVLNKQTKTSETNVHWCVCSPADEMEWSKRAGEGIKKKDDLTICSRISILLLVMILI